MIAATLLLALNLGTPREAILECMAYYQGLKKFSMDIKHQNSSGLFPGKYEQKLEWNGPKNWSLNVVKPSEFKPVDGEPGSLAPTYLCKDGELIERLTGGSERPGSEATDQTMPGWEVSGGPIMSWLAGTPSGKYYADGLPKDSGMSISLTWGSLKKWQDLSVREIILTTATAQGESRKFSMFLDVEKPRLLGLSLEDFYKNGWVKYSGQSGE